MDLIKSFFRMIATLLGFVFLNFQFYAASDFQGAPTFLNNMNTNFFQNAQDFETAFKNMETFISNSMGNMGMPPTFPMASFGNTQTSPTGNMPMTNSPFPSMQQNPNLGGMFQPTLPNQMWPNMMTRPTGNIQTTNPRTPPQQNQNTGPMRNRAFWKEWMEANHTLRNFEFDRDIDEKYNNGAGYETEEYCIYDLRMEYVIGSPDGVQKRMIGFNGQFPGPTLYCTNGKTMIVRVTNGMEDNDEPTTVHWHGIQQNLSPFYDGPQSVTQCPIIRSTSMIYKFQLFQSGTYWYHSHHSYQYVDGAWGFLIIRNTPEECWQNSYDEERLISINDWTHRPAKNISEVYLTQGNFPDTNSSLINGRGTFNCTNVEPGQICNPSLQGPAVVDVMQGKRYRFRILNSAAAIAYNFSIDGHKLTVIETDGVDTFKSPKVDIINIIPAHRYSVIVLMNQPLGEYWIRTSGVFPISTPGLLGRAILRYAPNPAGVSAEALAEPTQPASDALQGRPDFHDIPWNDIISSGGIQMPTAQELQQFFPNTPPKFDKNMRAEMDTTFAQSIKRVRLPTTNPVNPSTAILLDQNDVPPLQFGVDGSAQARYDRLIVINQTDCPLPGRPVRMCMNGQPYVPRSTTSRPTLFEVIRGRNIPSSSRPIYTPNPKEVIRVVINNFHQFEHPWHLHGHSFWVLGSGVTGAGPYVDSRDAPTLRTNGVRRDTTFTLGNSWAVIQYVTDNPGVWFFHCHINWHLEAGLGMNFIESSSVAREVYRFPPAQSSATCARVGVSIS